MVGQPDHRRILDRFMRAQKVFDLHRINVLSARDNDIFLAVHQIDKAVFIHLRHVAREQPAVFQDFGRGFGIVVVTLHHAVPFDAKLAHIALLHGVAVFIHNPDFPPVAGLSDRADFVDVFHAQMNAARTDGFRQAVVGVVVVVWKMFFPAFDQTGRHRLRADVHQPPLVELIIFRLNVSPLDGVQNVLRPRHQKPDNRDPLLGHRPEDPLRLDAAQQNRAASGQEAPEPVHLRAGVIQRRDAQEIIFARLPVMVHLHFTGHHQAAVVMKDRLGKTGGAG